jgi:hypothetical protein
MTVKPDVSPVIDEDRVEKVNRVVEELDQELEASSKKTREVKLPYDYKPWMRDEIIRRYREDGGWKHVSIHEDGGGKLYLSTRRARRWHENRDRMNAIDNTLMNATFGIFLGFAMMMMAIGSFHFFKFLLL